MSCRPSKLRIARVHSPAPSVRTPTRSTSSARAWAGLRVAAATAGDAPVVGARAGLLALRGERAAVPVDPRRVAALLGRHVVDRVTHRLPVRAAQRCAHLPGELVVVEARITGARVPLERVLVV